MKLGPFFWSGIGVGLLLTASGAALQVQGILGATPSLLILCSGLGIIFGAFGSTATIRHKGVVIAGVAAIAIVLLLLVEKFRSDDYVKIYVDGDVRGAQAELRGDSSFYVLTQRTHHEFLALSDGINGERLRLTIAFPSEVTGGDPREVIFECIDARELRSHLGSKSPLQWRFDDKLGQLIGEKGTRVIAEVGPCRGAARAPKVAWSLPSLVASAFAAEANVAQLLAELESPVTVVRREARQKLAEGGLDIVRPLMGAFSRPDASYRTRLGVVVALTEMLRTHKPQRSQVSALLTDDDLRRLVEAAVDPDRTIRVYAAEFLYDLGDKRGVPLALKAFPAASDNGKYNLIIIVQGALPDLGADERQRTLVKVRELRGGVGPKTQTLIDQIEK